MHEVANESVLNVENWFLLLCKEGEITWVEEVTCIDNRQHDCCTGAV
jgi:hypothetical protein